MPAVNGASLSGMLNAHAQSDEEARRNTRNVFGPLLILFMVLDIASAVAVVCMQCLEMRLGEEHEEDQQQQATAMYAKSGGGGMAAGGVGHCVANNIFWNSFHFHPMANTAQRSLGDLLVLAVLRCVATLLLLWVGITYGNGRGTDRQQQQQQQQTEQDVGTEAPSTTSTGGGVEAEDTLLESLLGPSTTTNRDHNGPESAARTCIVIPKRHSILSPDQVKAATFLCLFVSSTFYQVYAGLKVAAMNPDKEATHSTIETVKVILLCATIFWINAEAYVFRTLVTELTRHTGLFLPKEIHPHPLYLERNNRTMMMHWCDLCRQRIKPDDVTGEQACYRCSLCDFDLCLPCSRRQDAATVGENVLRGDRGVRVEAALTTTGYARRSLQVVGSEWPWLLASFVLLAASSVSRLFLPHFQGRIIDNVIPDSGTGQYDKGRFLHFIQIYIVLMVVQGFVSTLYSALFTLVSRRLKFTIRNALFEKILIQDVAYFDGTESGMLISRLTNDLDLMMAPIQSSLSSLLSNVLILAGGLVMCFAKSYRLSMLAFVTVGPITYLWEQYAIWSKGLAREMLSYWAEGNSIASQALGHIRTVKAFGCEDTVLGKYSDTNRMALYCGIKDAWGNGLTSALTGYLDLGSGVLILYFGGLLVYRGEMSVGDLVTYQLFWNMMNDAYQNLQGLITSFTRSAAGAEKIFSLWDSEPDIDPKRGDDINVDDVRGALRLENVSFHYQMRPDNVVLQEFSLDIPAGKTIALVGRSGGGKSTIINLLLRFYDPKAGRMLLDGKPYDSVKVNQLRRLFGVVTQETELFALTVEENIAYGLSKDEYTMDDVMEAATKACAHDFIVEMKDGYQTRIGERGNRLSGGQRQRLAIARVFLRKPKIILLDEATSALDENSQEAVQTALAKLIAESNATVVLVAHRLSTVVNADRICVIDKGTVLEQGDHEELVAKGGIYASMVTKQLSKRADLLDQEQKQKHGAAVKTGDQQQVAADDIDALLAESSS
jgi:ABC-type multidrug transport system fused ATPase/permease subunit